MNIKFTDIEIFEQLMKIGSTKIEFGSNLYGLKNSDSDTDIMVIYPDTIFERTSVFKNHHQFQYKDVKNNTDYIFTCISNFIRNLCNGDSTINFEIVHSGSLKNTRFDFLDQIKSEFITYKILRSYLGLARRDLTDYSKQKSERDKNKAILHGIRGYLYCKELLEHSDIKSFDISQLQNILLLNEKQRKEYSVKYQNLIKDLRDELNLKKGLVNYLRPDIQDFIDSQIVYEDFELPNGLKRLVYDSNEYGITY